MLGTGAGVATRLTGMATHASNATTQWWQSEPASLTQLSDLELPSRSDLGQWAALEMALARTFSSIDGACKAQQRRRQCVYLQRLLHCLSGARFGEARPGFMLHPELTDACQKRRVCDLFKSRSTFDLKHARAHRFWCSPRRVELDKQQRAVLSPRGDGNSYFVFDACGGLTNQRIALVQGFMIAFLTRSKAVLPSLNPNGVQRPRSGYREVRDRLVPFDDYYDRKAVEQNLLRIGVRVANRSEEELVERSRMRNAARASRPAGAPSGAALPGGDLLGKIAGIFGGFASEGEDEPVAPSPEDGAMHHYRVTTRGTSRDARWYADLAEMLSRRHAAPTTRAVPIISSAHPVPAFGAASVAAGTSRAPPGGRQPSDTEGPARGGGTEATGLPSSPVLPSSPAGAPVVLEADCAFFSIDMARSRQLASLFWQIESALVFSASIRQQAGDVISRLRAISRARGVADGRFHALHVRVEADWVEHCRNWEVPGMRDNCMRNTHQLDKVLAIEGVDRAPPLFVAGELTHQTMTSLPGLSTLVSNDTGYQLFSKDMLLGSILDGRTFQAQRDVLAAIDYEIIGKAHLFIGNSVSTFSALQLLWRSAQRRALTACDPRGVSKALAAAPGASSAAGAGPSPCLASIATGAIAAKPRPSPARGAGSGSRREAAEALDGFHYNGGDIPLRGVLFGDRPDDSHPARGLKWVFTVSASGHSYYEATRVAVLSALERTSLTPVCIFTGQPNALSAWLQTKGVRLIFHTPAWADGLLAVQRSSAAALGHARTSPLYASPAAMLATWVRLDAATLGFADRYVLYADVDVIFRRDVSVLDFGRPLPAYFTMGTEANGGSFKFGNGMRVGNAGVMLLNVDGLRRTHNKFIRWVFSRDNLKRGLHFGPYGPGDQGAYNCFYRGKFEVRTWPLFNFKPYWGFSPSAKLVHFHGPKPADYLAHALQPSAQDSPRLFDPLLERCGPPIAFVRTAAAEALSPGEWGGVGCFRYIQLYLRFRARLESDPLPGQADPRVLAEHARSTALLRNLSRLLDRRPASTEADPSTPTLCLIKVQGACTTFPAVSNLAFLDRSKGGPSHSGGTSCEARRRGWQADCGGNAKVTMRIEPTAVVQLGEGRAGREPVVAEHAAVAR